MHHTCGSIYRLLPKFIECGLDILQALQPGVAEMDFRRIKAEFGARLDGKVASEAVREFLGRKEGS